MLIREIPISERDLGLGSQTSALKDVQSGGRSPRLPSAPCVARTLRWQRAFPLKAVRGSQEFVTDGAGHRSQQACLMVRAFLQREYTLAETSNDTFVAEDMEDPGSPVSQSGNIPTSKSQRSILAGTSERGGDERKDVHGNTIKKGDKKNYRCSFRDEVEEEPVHDIKEVQSYKQLAAMDYWAQGVLKKVAMAARLSRHLADSRQHFIRPLSFRRATTGAGPSDVHHIAEDRG
eukprot:s2803_g1.t1